MWICASVGRHFRSLAGPGWGRAPRCYSCQTRAGGRALESPLRLCRRFDPARDDRLLRLPPDRARVGILGAAPLSLLESMAAEIGCTTRCVTGGVPPRAARLVIGGGAARPAGEDFQRAAPEMRSRLAPCSSRHPRRGDLLARRPMGRRLALIPLRHRMLQLLTPWAVRWCDWR